MRLRTPHRPGWSLIEMCVVMFGISVILGLLAVTIWSTMRIERAGIDAFTRMQEQIRLADVFREDVAQAHASPELGGDFSASPVCMILHRDDGALLVYRWLDGALERHILRNEQDEVQRLPVGGDDVTVEFSRRAGVISMHLIGRSRSPLVIAAALGGDRS